jgi:hypothetical protein
MLTIDFHSSVGEGMLDSAAIESLRAGRIDPKLLYVTPRQAELWRQVFLRHSPIHGNPEFARIYRESFARVSGELDANKVALVGLGCGTGMKERDLCLSLKARGREVTFSAIDISRNLVEESARKLVAAGADHRRSLVCDLVEADFLAEWLNRNGSDVQRLITFFGLVPNLAPSAVVWLFRAILRSKRDVILVSAHLAPVAEGMELPEAMRQILPQYDNAETLAWLSAALEQWELKDKLGVPEMKIGEMEGVPAIIATGRWNSSEPFEKWGEQFSPKVEEPLQLFHSLRYTPALFEELLKAEGFAVERLAMTHCREEAIWAIRR